jgi:hypothetical protein
MIDEYRISNRVNVYKIYGSRYDKIEHKEIKYEFISLL